MKNYYYRDKADKEIGPLTLDTLAKLRFAGVLAGDTPVRDADSTDWKPCREIISDVAAISSPVFESATISSGKSGFRLPVWSVCVFAAGLWLIFAWPQFQKNDKEKNLVNARNNIELTLADIENAKFQWALEKQKGLSATPTESDLLPYLLKLLSINKYTSFPQHPPGGSYVINAVKYPPESTQFGTWEDMEALDIAKKNDQPGYAFIYTNRLKDKEQVLESIAKSYGD